MYESVMCLKIFFFFVCFYLYKMVLIDRRLLAKKF